MAEGSPPRASLPVEPSAGVDSGWIIRRKISAPPLDDLTVPRPRLETLLARLLDQHRLVFVYASAGAGKTTAILQTADRLNRPLAWLNLESTDTATGRLLVYLEAALAVQLPEIAGVASSALAAQLAHPEVAGLLAEAIGDHPVLVVLDDAERLAGAPDALEVVAAFVRYLPVNARMVIASRSQLSFSSSVGASPWVAAVGEDDMAMTVDEASEALARSGRADIDPVDALVETGGWVTGVMFEAWRANDHVIGLGGEADPLHGYLATQILAQLAPSDASFLVRSSVLTEVTAARAEALGIANASARLHSLAGRRLPVSWREDGLVMRAHPRFREFLLKRLSREDEVDQLALRQAHAQLLVADGHDEEAVLEYLSAGCLAEAFELVLPVLDRVIERTDFALAEDWLRQLAPVRPADDITLASAELMLAVVRERFLAGVALADVLQAHGRRDALARSSGRAAALMGWCYLHAGRVDDIEQILAVAPPGPDIDAVRYSMRVVRDQPPPSDGATVGSLTGGPMDALVMRTHFDLGRLAQLTSEPVSPWAAKAAESWRVSALLSTGHTEQAFEVYHQLVQGSDQSVWLPALVGPRLMFEIGDHAEAWRLLHEGRHRITVTGSAMFEIYSLLVEAEFELRLNGDTAAALRILDRIAASPIGQGYAFLAEQRDMLAGRTLLAESRDAEAVLRLREAVTGMQRGGRMLFLVPAAVYLAEAEWRTGHEERADQAADLALSAAEQQGSNHYLLMALSDFPDVLARRIDLEHQGDTAWHALGRALTMRGVEIPLGIAATVEVHEFGTISVTADGSVVSPGLNKSVELLTFLANREREDVTRETLLDSMFHGRRDESASSYLRQAILKLRKVLPDALDVTSPQGVVRLSPDLRVRTESNRLIGLLGEAAAMRGPGRLAPLLAALKIADQGTYLSTIDSDWAEERRQRLDELVRSARLDAADVAFSAGNYQLAGQLADRVVSDDPYREAAWRLQMRLAGILGDHDRVIAAYRACERALAELGTTPSSTTAGLLRDLHR